MRQVDALRATLLARLGRPAEAAELLLLQGATGARRRAARAQRRAPSAPCAPGWRSRSRCARCRCCRAPAGLAAAERAAVYRQCQRYPEAAEEFARGGRARRGRRVLGGRRRVGARRAAVGGGRRDGARRRRSARAASAGARPRAASPPPAAWSWPPRPFETAGDPASAARLLPRGRPAAARGARLARCGRRGERLARAAADPRGQPGLRARHPAAGAAARRGGALDGALHRLELLPQDPTATGGAAVDRQYWEARALEGVGRLAGGGARLPAHGGAAPRPPRRRAAPRGAAQAWSDSGSASASPSATTAHRTPSRPAGGAGRPSCGRG